MPSGDIQVQGVLDVQNVGQTERQTAAKCGGLKHRVVFKTRKMSSRPFKDIGWLRMEFHGFAISWMVIIPKLYMVIHGYTWLYMAIHGYTIDSITNPR